MSSLSRIVTVSEVELFHDIVDNGGHPDRAFDINSHLSLAAALELDSILTQNGSAELNKVADRAFLSCPIWTLIKAMRSSQEARLSGDDLAVMLLPQSLNEVWLASEAKRLEDRLFRSRFPKNLSRSITGAVFEMVDNVWIHSESEARPLFCYRISSGAFTFGVADSGLGVLSTLKKNSRFAHVRTSMSALLLAVEPGVSGSPNGSGLGLPSLTRALAELWGRTRLRSGQAALTFSREGHVPIQSQQFLPEMRGFQISAVCRLRPPK